MQLAAQRGVGADKRARDRSDWGGAPIGSPRSSTPVLIRLGWRQGIAMRWSWDGVASSLKSRRWAGANGAACRRDRDGPPNPLQVALEAPPGGLGRAHARSTGLVERTSSPIGEYSGSRPIGCGSKRPSPRHQ